MMDDYYSLLGVDNDATVDDIRSAYRDRKESVDAASDSGKADVARLNKAWNVLSDPYQRGRYDQQRADASANGTLDTPDSVEIVQSNGRSAAKASGSAGSKRQPRQMGPPTLTPPAGTRWPVPKQRLIAMAIDLMVLLALFIAAGYIGESMAKNQNPAAYKVEKQINDHTLPDAQKAVSNADKALTAAKKTNDQAAIQRATDAHNAATANEKQVNTALDKATSKLTATRFGAIAAFFLLGMLYLVVPTIMSGRTLGKRLQHLRVLREDGSRLRAGDVIKRFGTLVIVTFALFTLLRLGPLAGVIVIVGVTTWTRNPNMQGIHDRFAHTMVVSDAD